MISQHSQQPLRTTESQNPLKAQMPDIILHKDKYPVFSTSTESEKFADVRRWRLGSAIKKELQVH